MVCSHLKGIYATIAFQRDRVRNVIRLCFNWIHSVALGLWSSTDENEAPLVLWTPLGHHFITTIADRSLVAGTSSAVDALAYDVIVLKVDRSICRGSYLEPIQTTSDQFQPGFVP